MIRLQHVSRRYPHQSGSISALDAVSLEIPFGSFVSVTGPSGCGKSTLLNLLGGLDTPDEGEIWIGDLSLHNASDTALTRHRRFDLGIVFQFFNLLPAMTVSENVELPLLLRGDPARISGVRVKEMLELVGLTDRATHFPYQLSGGEMQRIALARALAGHPRLLLADEPTGNLDSTNASHVMDTLKAIAARNLTTLILVTHDPALASLTDRQIKMRDGKVVSDESGPQTGGVVESTAGKMELARLQARTDCHQRCPSLQPQIPTPKEFFPKNRPAD